MTFQTPFHHYYLHYPLQVLKKILSLKSQFDPLISYFLIIIYQQSSHLNFIQANSLIFQILIHYQSIFLLKLYSLVKANPSLLKQNQALDYLFLILHFPFLAFSSNPKNQKQVNQEHSHQKMQFLQNYHLHLLPCSYFFVKVSFLLFSLITHFLIYQYYALIFSFHS